MELIRRRTDRFTKIDQDKRKTEQICIWNPHDYRIYYVNIDLRHQYGISVAESALRRLASGLRYKRLFTKVCMGCKLFFLKERKNVLKKNRLTLLPCFRGSIL